MSTATETEHFEVYAVSRPTDFSEGRSFARDVTLWADKQAAWDQVNDLPGVQGSHPSTWSRSCGKYPTWQAYAEDGNIGGDYQVIAVQVIGRLTDRSDPADDLESNDGAIPLVPDERLKVREPTSLSLRELFRKDRDNDA